MRVLPSPSGTIQPNAKLKNLSEFDSMVSCHWLFCLLPTTHTHRNAAGASASQQRQSLPDIDMWPVATTAQLPLEPETV